MKQIQNRDRYILLIVSLGAFVCASSMQVLQFGCKEEHNAKQCYKLGIAYADGIGVEKDIKKAKRFLGIACKRGGIQQACNRIASLDEESGSHSSTIPVTRNGVTRKMVAYNYWSGEYPKPVINVAGSVKGWIKIKGYASLRKLTKKKVCTIKTGIYHPWSKDNTSVIDYFTITGEVDYKARKSFLLDEKKIKKGDTLENEMYIAEGSCSYLWNKKKEIETTCIEEAAPSSSVYRRIKYPAHPREQWLYLDCREGYHIFVRDVDLLRVPNIRKGRIVGYGKVAK